MESFGAFPDAESLFHLNSSEFVFSNHVQIQSSLLAENMAQMDNSIFFTTDTDFSSVPQESGECSEFDGGFLLDHGCGNLNANGGGFLHDESIPFYLMDCENDNLMVPVFTDETMEEILQSSNAGKIQAMLSSDSCQEMQLKRKYETTSNQVDLYNGYEIQSHEDKSADKKRSRVSKDQNKRSTSAKKNKKVVAISNDIEEENIINSSLTNGQSSSSFSSEDDHSNASQDNNAASNSELNNSKGKARANRGSATDPQSLYARRRRERINERLRILQNLVPNGTKVDISTMLEEAVQYVKFLQLQIKLLSSDELWMYAPIAYNGMNIGLYDKISPNLLS
ncbi:hypothetical protein F511_13824 [Dorcoceras hygrometricum]|uniref:BHLH domain-containing protein n=1 Tax=Dorcoceras hygrometricum TaxID=472368 RepID=A0A2Z7D9B6_9LAMI|nr:hypothetical protein F511_13824 [Dorcoceras hygrometricum]